MEGRAQSCGPGLDARADPAADRRRLATLFVDIASSTSLLVHHPPEIVLGVVQCFFDLVTETASRYDGHVKDYEGDGALLYFGSEGGWRWWARA